MRREKSKGETVMDSLYQLSGSGRSWIAAEAALAKAELRADGQRFLVIVELAAMVMGCVFSAIMLLSLFLVAVLAPFVGGLSAAAGLLALGFFAVAAATGLVIYYMSRRQLGISNLAKRWFNFAAHGLSAKP